MKRAKVLICCLIATLFLATLTVSGQDEKEQAGAGEKGQTELLWEMINLLVENNPSLRSQRSLLEEVQRMPMPGAGFIDVDEITKVGPDTGGENTPFISLSQVEEIRSMWLERKRTLEEVRQNYEDMKKLLVSELFSKVTEISSLQNRKEALEELRVFLGDRADALERQIRAGVGELSDLFDLKERIMQTEVDIKDASERIEVLKLETAINLGGERWREMLDLLNQVE